MTSRTVHLGFEVDTRISDLSNRRVEIPIKHMAVTGQTQESGKTTTLEGWPEAPPNISNSSKALTQMGFLRDVGGRYQAVEGMKVNVVSA